MNAWLQQLISRSILNPLQQKGARLLQKAALFAAAALALLFAIVFLSVAFFIWIAQLAGVLIACLAFGAAFLIVGIILLLVAFYSGREKPQKEIGSQHQRNSDKAQTESLSAEGQDHLAQDQREEIISEAVIPVLEILRSLGLKREELALLAGAELAKTLPPLTLVGFAIICGFLIGRMSEIPANFLTRKKAA